MNSENETILPDVKIVTCPHTGKEVVAQYDPGNQDGVPDYLCLHNDTEEQDAEDVIYFKLHNQVKQRPS